MAAVRDCGESCVKAARATLTPQHQSFLAMPNEPVALAVCDIHGEQGSGVLVGKMRRAHENLVIGWRTRQRNREFGTRGGWVEADAFDTGGSFAGAGIIGVSGQDMKSACAGLSTNCMRKAALVAALSMRMM